jgi:hypothetical protein
MGALASRSDATQWLLFCPDRFAYAPFRRGMPTPAFAAVRQAGIGQKALRRFREITKAAGQSNKDHGCVHNRPRMFFRKRGPWSKNSSNEPMRSSCLITSASPAHHPTLHECIATSSPLGRLRGCGLSDHVRGNSIPLPK